MTEQPIDNGANSSRREFLKTTAQACAAISLAGVVAPAIDRDPNVRADAWFDKKMADRQFVQSDFGAFFQDGKKGYWSGGPGASAQTIYNTLRGDNGRQGSLGPRISRPHDASDFGRCVELLNEVPEWRSRMGEMANISPEWRALSRKWGDIENLFRAGNKEATTALIKSAIAA